ARTARGAIDERIAVAAIVRVEQLGETRVARRGIRRDVDRGIGLEDARGNAKIRVAPRRDGTPDNRLDPRERWSGAGELVLESYEGLAIAFNLHFDTTAVVGHESTQIQPGGEGVDERPEANALHDARDFDG